MKSLYFSILVLLFVFIKHSLAFATEDEEPFLDEQKLINNFEESHQEQEQPKEGIHTSTLVYSGIGVTGVAFVLAIGFKNYRSTSAFNKFKQEILSSTETIVKEDASSNTKRVSVNVPSKSSSKGKNEESVIQMQPLLSEAENSENFALTKNRAYKCLTSWTPQNSDEIILRRGDLICVKECFNDGYTLGRNLSTKFDGIFPTCCLARPEQHILGYQLIRNGKFTSIPLRVSSKNKSGKRARRASRGISILPGWTQGNEISTFLK